LQVLKVDTDRCVHVGGAKLTERPLQAFGLRVQDNFCTELQAHMLLMEVHELLTKYGYSLPDDQTPVYTMSSLREVPPPGPSLARADPPARSRSRADGRVGAARCRHCQRRWPTQCGAAGGGTVTTIPTGRQIRWPPGGTAIISK